MEFPWDYVALSFSAITLVALLGYNTPKFIKAFSPPKIDIDLYIYPEKHGKQQGVIQVCEGKICEKEIEVLPNVSPQIVVRIKPEWKYKVTMIEAIGSIGHFKSVITRVDHFAKKRHWLEKEYTDVEGNYKVSPDITIRKGHTTDPLVLDLQIDPPLKNGEQRRIKIRVSTEESRKMLEKEFIIKVSTV